jgi:hypothetical protein
LSTRFGDEDRFQPVRPGTREQDAVRILFLLDRAGQPIRPGAPSGAVSACYTQTRLQSMLFWMRNPDYLANELVNEYEAGRTAREAVEEAARIMRSDEPDLRTFHMVRFFYGAYEALDDSLALLRSVGFLQQQRLGTPTRVKEHAYFLLPAGREAANRMLVEMPAVQWYADRASLIGRIAGDAAGTALKQRQHDTFEYHETQLGERIRSIRELVLNRLMTTCDLAQEDGTRNA